MGSADGKTYQFETHFTTTDEDLSNENPLATFEITPEEEDVIRQGAILAVVEEGLMIEEPSTGIIEIVPEISE